jgi:hypothetical protein
MFLYGSGFKNIHIPQRKRNRISSIRKRKFWIIVDESYLNLVLNIFFGYGLWVSIEHKNKVILGLPYQRNVNCVFCSSKDILKLVHIYGK